MRASRVLGGLMSACFALAVLAGTRPAAAAGPDEGYYGEGPSMEEPYDDGAAGIDGRDYGHDGGRYGGDGYDDKRAPPPGDRFGAAPPDRFRGADPGRGADTDRWDGVPAARGSLKDGYPVPMPAPRVSVPPPRHVERPPVRIGRHACLDPWQIRRQLRWEGWTGVRPMGGDGGIVRMRAGRFDSSSVFDLRVDRCSGEVLAAWPRPRHFAGRDWHWDRRGW